MTQQWGTQGQRPGQGGQQWGSRAGTGRRRHGVRQRLDSRGTRSRRRPRLPAGAGALSAGRRVPTGQFGQPTYGQPGGFPPANRPQVPGGPERGSPFRALLLGLVVVVGLGFFAISLVQYLGGGGDGPLAQPTGSQTVEPPVAVPAPDFSRPRFRNRRPTARPPTGSPATRSTTRPHRSPPTARCHRSTSPRLPSPNSPTTSTG